MKTIEIINILTDQFLISSGFLVRRFPNLIVGYNTMSDERKKNVDIHGLQVRNNDIINIDDKKYYDRYNSNNQYLKFFFLCSWLWFAFGFQSFAQQFSLRCNKADIPVKEQNDVPYSYGLNAYKYAQLTYEGKPLSIEITATGFDFSNEDWDILPSSYGLTGTKNRNRLHFNINQTGYIVVRFKKNHDFSKRLVIFVEPPEQRPNLKVVNIVQSYGVDSTGATNQTAKIQKALNEIAGTGRILYFPPGTYKSFMLNISSNSKIHLSKGACIIADVSSIDPYQDGNNDGPNRFILIRNARNISITGLGSFDGNGTYFRGIYDPNGSQGKGGMRLFYIVNSKNISFDGILLKDAARWNTHITGCEEVVFRNCKMINNPNENRNLTNFDGWDPDASKRVLIENCFGWAGDDNIAIKCVGTGNPQIIKDVEDITIKGCVFLTKKSALKIGTETRCGTIRNIRFENNDVIEADRVIAIDVKDGAIVDGVRYINCRSEFCFPDNKQMGINIFLKKRNDEQAYIGKIKNVLIESCSFKTKFPNGFRIYRDPDQTAANDLQVIIKNLSVAEQKIEHLDKNYFNLEECNGDIMFND